MLHRVLPHYDPDNYYFQRGTAISWQRFIQLLDHIEKQGFQTRPISALSDSPQPDSIYLTFDDGYADNASVFDELLRRNMTATLYPAMDFVRTGFSPIDDMAWHLMVASSLPDEIKQSLINGRLKKLLRKLSASRYRSLRQSWFHIETDAPSVFLTESQLVHYVHRGIELGFHGVSHRPLTALNEKEIKHELELGMAWLRQLSPSPIHSICYPHGKYNALVLCITRCYLHIHLTVDTPTTDSQVYSRIFFQEMGSLP